MGRVISAVSNFYAKFYLDSGQFRAQVAAYAAAVIGFAALLAFARCVVKCLTASLRLPRSYSIICSMDQASFKDALWTPNYRLRLLVSVPQKQSVKLGSVTNNSGRAGIYYCTYAVFEYASTRVIRILLQ